ncbi:PLP-dependent aminotransferase family protein [Rugamonas sp. CCM 8940]|nr:PLP-dependent aminotransferase family protein [Rugamonas sp. CCM 8940]
MQGSSSRLDVMNFLNEMSGNFPNAISFASGRPTEQFFALAHWMAQFPLFARHFAAAHSLSEEAAVNVLSQYGRTNGIIDDLIAAQVGLDEGIACGREQIIVTAGCQEAIELCLRALFESERDVLLVRSPAYIGITGVAELHGIEVAGLSCAVDDTLAFLRAAVERLEGEGKRPRALYLVPDFDNPTGAVLSRAARLELIAFCSEKSITVLEDNPYGMFRYEGEPIAPMFALDQAGCVVYLGTYSKTICPALRVGFAIFPKQLGGSAERTQALMHKISQIKSLLTCNTSQVSQAIVGGLLLSENGSLKRLVEGSVDLYRHNRDTMLACLEETFKKWEGRISWNRPQGGFFLTLSLPFKFLGGEAASCARDYGVLAMPLSFFALDEEQDYCLRLAFSNVTPERIEEGIGRLGRFVEQRMATPAERAAD